LNKPQQRPIARRGEIWFVSADTVIGAENSETASDGRRPTQPHRRNLTTEYGLTILVVPFTDSEGKITSVIRPLVVAGRGSGLSKNSLAACDQVRCVDGLRLINKIGELSSPDMTAVVRGLFEILDPAGSY
jgi:mRNA-degrading endonuclease toxin of MazEF toxin-antitoxin module